MTTTDQAAYFHHGNTSGFTDVELASMNAAYRELLTDYDPEDPSIDDVRKQIGDDICDAIGIVGAGGYSGATDIVSHVRGLRGKR